MKTDSSFSPLAERPLPPARMPIIIKTRREIDIMRRAGALGASILEMMRQMVRPGVSTGELNELAARELGRNNAIGLSKGYMHDGTYRPGEPGAYPAETCISVNEVVVHGIPGSQPLREGDIVTLDLALKLDGYCADTAITVPVGRIDARTTRLLEVTREALKLALSNIRPGRKWSDIARLIQYHVESNGFSVVREFVGHGVGRSMHEEPKVPNFVTAEQLRGDFKLRPGMTIAVEPMVVMGKREVVQLEDNWTIVTADRMPAAHFEHTIAVTEAGVDVLTDTGQPVPDPITAES